MLRAAGLVSGAISRLKSSPGNHFFFFLSPMNYFFLVSLILVAGCSVPCSGLQSPLPNGLSVPSDVSSRRQMFQSAGIASSLLFVGIQAAQALDMDAFMNAEVRSRKAGTKLSTLRINNSQIHFTFSTDRIEHEKLQPKDRPEMHSEAHIR